MTKKQEIAWRAEQEAKSLALAKKYVRTKDYLQAAESYRRVAFHQAVRQSLEKRR